ncbi:DUF11 domain-containing protein [Vibrio barjaei]|jgi:uncharacterized repeat protein (TIGR01451 family)|uniref:DUF7507 domain-containing protein n=1 Tax=Vibrio barjaei TaxID=1676683 RepID=UPI0007BC017E|nr:DUF11 domain-containing protein [Vibrio barjaei]MCY9871842.1 DUF11 domain-containing protein [Vibrio barjaei]OIN23796.1 hypothetical protein AWH66_2001400 [Vibrio barjaei]
MKNNLLQQLPCSGAALALGLMLTATPTEVLSAGYDFGDDYERRCMADAYLLKPGNSLPQNQLNCTANDVEITNVVPVGISECTPGQVVSFDADVTIRTNANERYDTTFYLPLTSQSPKVVQGGAENCSLILPKPGDSGEIADVQLDGDECGDISKAGGLDEYVLVNERINMLCVDNDDDGRADFTYCAAWDNINRNNCTVDDSNFSSGQIPNTKSKCNCDTFNIDLFIRPNPPSIVKTLVSDNNVPEPGGKFDYTVSFTNPSSTASLFIASMTDEISVVPVGSAPADYSVDLLSSPVSSPTQTDPDGAYLVANTCNTHATEIMAGASLSCSFSVYIKDIDLNDTNKTEVYRDTVKIGLQDKNEEPVGDGSTCPIWVSSQSGDNCSAPIDVTITNVKPSVSIVKEGNVSSVTEPGGQVTYTITVTNTSAYFDSPVTISSFTDTLYDLSSGTGTCSTGAVLGVGEQAICTYTESIVGNFGDASILNTASVTIADNESDTASGSESHSVAVLNVPSSISLLKEANPTSVPETGDDPSVKRSIEYTFTITVDSNGVDTVSFSSLLDDKFGELVNECLIGGITPLANYVANPGDVLSCQISRNLQGNAGGSHTNEATVKGTDADGQAVMDVATATVNFTDVLPTVDVAFAPRVVVVLQVKNTSIEDVTFQGLTLFGQNVLNADVVDDGFTFRNIGGTYNEVFYPACQLNQSITYAGSASDTYLCAFVIDFTAGLDDVDVVNFNANAGNAVQVTVEDEQGNSANGDIDIQLVTQE